MSLTGDRMSPGGGGGGSSKTIKCFCNDDLCGVPSSSSSSRQSSNTGTAYPPHLAEFLIKNPSLKFRTCQTETACMTKRFKRPDATYYYKYYCDHHSQPTGINSIRHQVIAYRDCRVDSLALPAEREHVLEAYAEHCCSDQDYCNVLLKPTAFVRDPLEYTNNNNNEASSSSNNNKGNEYPSAEDISPSANLFLNVTNNQSPVNGGIPSSLGGGGSSNQMGPGHVVLVCFSGFLLALIVILLGVCLFRQRKSNKLRMFLKKPSKLIQPSGGGGGQQQQNGHIIMNGDVNNANGGVVGTSGGVGGGINSSSAAALLTSSSNNSNTTTTNTSAASCCSSAPSPYSTSTTSTSLNSKENSLNNPLHLLHQHQHQQQQKLIEESFSSSAAPNHRHTQLNNSNNKQHGGGLYSAELKSGGVNADLFEPLLGGNSSHIDDDTSGGGTARVFPNHTIALFGKGVINTASVMSPSVIGGGIVIKSPLTHSNTLMSSSGMTNPTTMSVTTTTGISSLNTTTNQPNSRLNGNNNNDEWSGSGSGAGMPECMNRTIARQIKLTYPCIGKGRFGEVYKGEWRGENVAVKTFNSADEKSWENECNIYNTSGFRHENILGFIAADNIDRGLYTELWLITEYHGNGSLHDYLTSNQITIQQGIQMLLSIATGLDHLHTPIESYKGKPALAHCDLKSKNILVKSNLTCCIGDLGLAIRGDREGRVVLAPGTSLRMGTKRYLAPEILTKQLDQSSQLIVFQRAEIYSLGLIMWEVLRACRFESQCVDNTVYSFEYKLPYHEYINNQTDPDEALMKQIVCDLQHRPLLLPQWNEHATMKDLTQLCTESWDQNPNARNTALRIKKSLTRIAQKHNQEQQQLLPLT